MTKSILQEGIHDRGIFKAVFMAGGPGSGKDYVVHNAITGLGLVEINQDLAFEHILRSHDMAFTMPDDQAMLRQLMRNRAKDMTASKSKLALAGRLGIILNGTGANYDDTYEVKNSLEGLGYSTMMVYVNVDDETSKERNYSRGQKGGRMVPETIRAQKYIQAHQNITNYQYLFGPNFHLIDTSNTVDRTQHQKDLLGAFKTIMKFVNRPLVNPVALNWIDRQKAAMIHEEVSKKSFFQFREDTTSPINDPNKEQGSGRYVADMPFQENQANTQPNAGVRSNDGRLAIAGALVTGSPGAMGEEVSRGAGIDSVDAGGLTEDIAHALRPAGDDLSKQALSKGMTYSGLGRWSSFDGKVKAVEKNKKLIPFKGKSSEKSMAGRLMKHGYSPTKAGEGDGSLKDILKKEKVKSDATARILASYYGENLDPQDLKAIQSYAAEDHYSINNHLVQSKAASGDISTKGMKDKKSKEVVGKIGGLDSAINKCETPIAFRVYTGTKSGEYEIGKKYVFHGYLSTTLDHEVANEFGGTNILMIDVPKGSPGVYIGAMKEDDAPTDDKKKKKPTNDADKNKEFLLSRASQIEIVDGPLEDAAGISKTSTGAKYWKAKLVATKDDKYSAEKTPNKNKDKQDAFSKQPDSVSRPTGNSKKNPK